MAVKKNTYIDQELLWLERKANELRQYVDDRPFNELKDRMHYKETKNGGAMPMISATIESQLSALTKALKEYADIIKVIGDMREQEAKKEELRKGFNDKDILDEDDN
jgi:hypothetical protein